MSGWLRWRDTTIIIIATIGTITGTFITAFTTSLNVLYFAYILWMLWNTITTISRSGISKFMESNEVGKAFTVLGILQTLFPFITKPFFSYLYKSTLETFPGAYRVLCGSLYILVSGKERKFFATCYKRRLTKFSFIWIQKFIKTEKAAIRKIPGWDQTELIYAVR